MRWAVCDMDEGVLRWEPTRKAAVTWLLGHACTERVLQRRQYAVGDYEYTVGATPEDGQSWWIVREDQLQRGGWDASQPASFPFADNPWQAA